MLSRSLIVRLALRSALALLWLGVPTLVPCLRAAQQTNSVTIDTDTATAAYLLSFVRFTEWPAGDWAGTSRPGTATSPYVIGVSGSRPLLDTLIRLVEGQQVRGRPVHVVRIKDVRDLAVCHLVYLNPSPDDDGLGVPIPIALDALRGEPVLTVSAATDFLAQGGLVQLYRADSHLRFDIATETARAAGITLNSRLLALARPVPARP
jgi:hypothetical protein